LVSLAAERRYNFSHGRKPVDGDCNVLPSPVRGGTEVVPPLFLRLRSIELVVAGFSPRSAEFLDLSRSETGRLDPCVS